MFRRLLLALTAVCALLTVGVWAAPPGTPRADYRFGLFNGTTVPNSSGDMPALTMHQADWSLPGDGTLYINETSTYTHDIPFDESQGTYLKTETAFTNTFSSGTIGIRLKPESWMDHGGGATWDPGGVVFHRDPISEDAFPPIEIAYYGTPQVPYFFFGEKPGAGVVERVFATSINDFQNLTAFNLIAVWNATTMSIYYNGTQTGTKTRTQADDPVANLTLWVGADHSLIHSADRQFFAGWLHRLVVYDDELNETDIGLLNTALSEGLDAPAAVRKPRSLRKVRVR